MADDLDPAHGVMIHQWASGFADDLDTLAGAGRACADLAGRACADLEAVMARTKQLPSKITKGGKKASLGIPRVRRYRQLNMAPLTAECTLVCFLLWCCFHHQKFQLFQQILHHHIVYKKLDAIQGIQE